MSSDDNSPLFETGSARARRGSGPESDALGPVSDDYSYAPQVAESGTTERAPSARTPAPAPTIEPIAPPAAKRNEKKQGLTAVREIVETLLLAFVIFVAVRAVVLNFKVDGESMFPNLQDQEMLLVNRNVYFHFDLNGALDALPFIERDGERIVYPFHPPERGDIIVFNPPTVSDKPFIKRVIGLPGDTVSIENGFVYINGVQLDEPYIEGGITECNRSRCDPIVVPEGSVYVMGDNRRNSSDSRIFGTVEVEDIIGKAWVTYWPFSEFGLVPHFDYPEIAD